MWCYIPYWIKHSRMALHKLGWLYYLSGRRTQDGFIQHKITLGNIISGVQCKTILPCWKIWTWHNQKYRNACWETSTQVMANGLRRGHPGRGGTQRSVVDICKSLKESAAGYIYWWPSNDITLLTFCLGETWWWCTYIWTENYTWHIHLSSSGVVNKHS